MQSHRFAVRAAAGILLLLSMLMGIIGVSALFVADDPFPRDAQVLIATFAAGMAILGIAIILTGFRRRQWWAWLALWYYPVFFIIHVVALGTVIPDAAFAALAAAALLLARPDRAAHLTAAGMVNKE